MSDKKYAEMEHTFVDKFDGNKEVTVKIRFACPTSSAVARAQTKMMKNPGQSFHNLCVGCVHEEDKDAMLTMFDAYPGLPTTFGSALLSSAGFGDLGN